MQKVFEGGHLKQKINLKQGPAARQSRWKATQVTRIVHCPTPYCHSLLHAAPWPWPQLVLCDPNLRDLVLISDGSTYT